jgi:hypothetical protein
MATKFLDPVYKTKIITCSKNLLIMIFKYFNAPAVPTAMCHIYNTTSSISAFLVSFFNRFHYFLFSSFILLHFICDFNIFSVFLGGEEYFKSLGCVIGLLTSIWCFHERMLR